jgi:hypothetical protein
VNGDDVLSAAEAAEPLGVDEDWINARKFRGPCSMRLRDRAVTILRRDLPRWAEMVKAESIERREAPSLSPDQVRFLQRAKASAARLGDPSRWQ